MNRINESVTEENMNTTPAWVTAIKANVPIAWLIGEALAVSNQGDLEEVIGYGMFPPQKGTTLWSMEQQTRVHHTMSILKICFEALMDNPKAATKETWDCFSSAFMILYNPQNHIRSPFQA